MEASGRRLKLQLETGEKAIGLLLKLSFPVGFAYLFHYCHAERIPFPILLSELPALLISIGVLGVLVSVFLGGFFLLPALGRGDMFGPGYDKLYSSAGLERAAPKSERANRDEGSSAMTPQTAEDSGEGENDASVLDSDNTSPISKGQALWRNRLRPWGTFAWVLGLPMLFAMLAIFADPFGFGRACLILGFIAAALSVFAWGVWRRGWTALGAALGHFGVSLLWVLAGFGLMISGMRDSEWFLAQASVTQRFLVFLGLLLIVILLGLMVVGGISTKTGQDARMKMRPWAGIGLFLVLVSLAHPIPGAFVGKTVLRLLNLGGEVPAVYGISDDMPDSIRQQLGVNKCSSRTADLKVILDLGTRAYVRRHPHETLEVPRDWLPVRYKK